MAKKPKYTISDFEQEFPNDDACLEWLKDFLYPAGVHCPNCDRVTKHHKVKSRRSYSCQECGHHVHPTAGTIYHKSRTPLKLWFYAIFLMSSTRCGISAKQLERELGVTYKTAWRMFKQIRSMLQENRPKLSGNVEVDETFIGGKPRGQGKNRETKPKITVVGAVERGGAIVTEIVPDTTTQSLQWFVRRRVEAGSTVNTDEHGAYFHLRRYGFRHRRIAHWDKIYVRGDVHTNTIEGFWGNFKTGMRGVYKHCGEGYLPSYLGEYEFRYSNRNSNVPMFQLFLAQHEQQAWWTPYHERG
jgi:transposase-like protein